MPKNSCSNNVQGFSRVATEYSMSTGNCPMLPLSVCDTVYGITNILDF